MAKSDLFNIDILVLNNENVKLMREVKTGIIFTSSTNNFHPDGLFSTEIFGPVGSKSRSEQYGYINLGLPILHPLIYETIVSLSSKYLDISEGKKYAKFDKTIEDFVISTQGEGRTGYNFLLEFIHKVKFNDNKSDQRRYKIELVKKFAKPEYMSTKWLVIPAGLRDYTEDDKGTPSEDEINNLYRKLLGTCNMVKNTNVSEYLELLDPIRLKVQKTTLEIYNYIKTLLDGKSKFIQGKFAKRATRYGTRNVLTPIPAKITNLKDKNNISLNDTQVGLYQYVKAISPITINRVQSLFINHLLNPNSTTAYLINPETMKTELVNIKAKKRDEWLTIEGMTNTMNKLSQADLRFEPVKIDGYYMGLVYDNGKDISIYLHTDDIPSEIDTKKLRPLTYAEMFYISVYDVRKKYPAMITRYPVAGQGGIYPSNVYLKTTTKSRVVNFSMGVEKKEMVEYPILNSLFYESMSVNLNKLKNLGGDEKKLV